MHQGLNYKNPPGLYVSCYIYLRNFYLVTDCSTEDRITTSEQVNEFRRGSRMEAWREGSRLVDESLNSYLRDDLLPAELHEANTSYDHIALTLNAVEARVPMYNIPSTDPESSAALYNGDNVKPCGIDVIDDHTVETDFKEDDERSVKKQFSGGNIRSVQPNGIDDTGRHFASHNDSNHLQNSTDASDIDRRINALKKFLDKARYGDS